MAFKRKKVEVELLPDEKTLTARMRGIGMSFVSEETDWAADFEMTLVHASITGLEQKQYRVLRSLCAWVEVHFSRINVDRLFKILEQCESQLVLCFWSALSAGLLKSDLRFKRVIKLYSEPTIQLLGDVTDFQVVRHGIDERFDSGRLELPANFIPFREDDVFSPAFMMKHSRTYFWRTLIGSNWRADAWTYLESRPESTASETANALGCSYGAAWKYVQDFRLCNTESGIMPASL